MGRNGAHSYYNAIVVGIAPGGPLPTLGQEVMTKSAMTGNIYAVKVKRILALDWGEDGELIVTVQGDKRMVGEEAS